MCPLLSEIIVAATVDGTENPSGTRIGAPSAIRTRDLLLRSSWSTTPYAASAQVGDDEDLSVGDRDSLRLTHRSHVTGTLNQGELVVDGITAVELELRPGLSIGAHAPARATMTGWPVMTAGTRRSCGWPIWLFWTGAGPRRRSHGCPLSPPL